MIIIELITPKISILDFVGTATAVISTTSATLSYITTPTLSADDFIVNTTRDNTSRRIVSTAPVALFNLNDTIDGQTEGDAIRLYAFTDHTDLVKQSSINFTYRNQEQSEIEFDMSTTAAYIPRVGQYIRLFLNDILYFTGMITDVSRRLYQESITEKILVHVRAGSLKIIPPRRTVTVLYDIETTASTVVSDMINQYLNAEGIEAGEIADGINLEEAWLDDCISVGDILDQMADKSGYQWFIDKNFKLQFYQDVTVSDCTYSISDNGTASFTDFSNVTIDETVENYLNKVFIAGSQDQNGNFVIVGQQNTTSILEAQNYSAGTGVWGGVDRNSAVKEASYEIAESGTSETAFVIGTVSILEGDEVFNITRGFRATVISASAPTYTIDRTISGQTASDTIIVYETANGIARNTLKRQGQVPRSISFDTWHLGFNPAERLNVELSTLGIASSDYVIDEVNIRHEQTDYFKSTVKAILRDTTDFSTQRNPNSADYFKKLGANSSTRPGFGVQRGSTNPRVTVAGTTPSAPKNGDVFIDTSVTPPKQYYYNANA